ncbi:MAG: hypothetical protein ACE5JX_16130, partial [Acidobacteriota bacterium]
RRAHTHRSPGDGVRADNQLRRRQPRGGMLCNSEPRFWGVDILRLPPAVAINGDSDNRFRFR